MGKLNEIQEQVTQSYGSNSFTTKITDQTVEFDSAKDSFTFMDEVNVPALNVNGQASVAFTAEEKAKLAKVTTPMNMKGRVDSVADLPTENVSVGDTYLVGPEGSVNFEEYVCTALEGSPETPVWENIGHIKVQPDWNQSDSNAEDFIKNRTHYVDSEFVQVDSESVEVSEIYEYLGEIESFEGEIVNDAQYTIVFDGVTYQAVGYTSEWGDNAIYYYDLETEAVISVQQMIPIKPMPLGGDLSEEDEDDSEPEWIVNTYGITPSGKNVTLVVTDANQNVMVDETVSMEGEAEGYLETFSDTISADDTYKVIIDGDEYEATVVEGQGKDEGHFYIVCDDVCQISTGFGEGYITIYDPQYTNKTISLVIEKLQEVVHTLADKFLSANIVRTSDLPESVIKSDSALNIYSDLLQNTIQTGAAINTILGTQSGNTIGGSLCVLIGGSATSNTVNGANHSLINPGSSNNISGDKNIVISSWGVNSFTNSSGCTVIGGGNNTFSGTSNSTIISGTSGYSSFTNSPGSLLLGGVAPSTFNNAAASMVACSIGGNNNITQSDSGAIIGGYSNTIQNVGKAFIVASGNSEITKQTRADSYSTIIGGVNNKIKGTSGYCSIIGGSSNVIENLSNTVIIGGSSITATESNTVYVPTLKATTGVTTKKMTIAGIDPADVFMHSEIIDASSDVSFSRVLANTSSTKTDGYVEILYKASSGVTCTAYIDSTDVALTADGAWHKLEQGCNPAAGVEIHINNSAPVTDATLEVISKVYYI